MHANEMKLVWKFCKNCCSNSYCITYYKQYQNYLRSITIYQLNCQLISILVLIMNYVPITNIIVFALAAEIYIKICGYYYP